MSTWSEAVKKQRIGNSVFSKSIAHESNLRLFVLFCVALVGLIIPELAVAQSNSASIRFDSQTQVFHIDAGDTSYVFGINENKQLQTLYWGNGLKWRIASLLRTPPLVCRAMILLSALPSMSLLVGAAVLCRA